MSHEAFEANKSLRIALLSSAVAAVAVVLSYGVGKDVKSYETTGCPVKVGENPLQWIEAPIANSIGAEEEQHSPFRYCIEHPR